MTNKITENDYTYVENPNHSLYGVRLLTGKYKDVIYQYGKVSIKESPELDIATLQFTYNIQEVASFTEDDLINDNEFKNHLGDVLTHIIETRDKELDGTIDADTYANTEPFAE